VVRTIPPYLDSYDAFVKARPIPDDGAPLGELGCYEAYFRALANARRFVYIHAKHMIVDDLWMVISSSSFSRRGMSYETEIGAAVSDAAVEDGARKVVRDHRVRLWAEHLQLDRRRWHLLLDPAEGFELLRRSLDNPNLFLVPFEPDNPDIAFAYAPENHDGDMELVYDVISDPDGTQEDAVDLTQAQAIIDAILNG
jgi:phosphatidylserine/phosphatidylglycerophosphate/cardiolipin synthase-like enzyme